MHELSASLPSSVVRHMTHVGGLHIHWAEAGSGRPTVLLHGVCDSHRTWRKVVPMLVGSRRLLMPDLPGHGLSDRPDAPYTVEWYAAAMADWIDALHLSSFDLIGHSFGGGVAQMLLLSHGDRVRRLALVASGGLGREVSLGLRLWSIAEVNHRFTQPFLAPSTRLAISTLLPGADPEDVDFLSWMNAMPGTARALTRTVRSAVDWRGQKLHFFDRAHELRHPLPPIQLFWGDRDQVVPVEHGADMMSRLEHVNLTRFEGCGHFPHQEVPEPFSTALARFLDEPALEGAVLRGRLVVVPRLRWWQRWWRALVGFWRRVIGRAVARKGSKKLPPMNRETGPADR